MNTGTVAHPRRRLLTVTLALAQILLALSFGVAGAMKLRLSMDALAASLVPVNLVLAALAAFVAWGRGTAVPIRPRG